MNKMYFMTELLSCSIFQRSGWFTSLRDPGLYNKYVALHARYHRETLLQKQIPDCIVMHEMHILKLNGFYLKQQVASCWSNALTSTCWRHQSFTRIWSIQPILYASSMKFNIIKEEERHWPYELTGTVVPSTRNISDADCTGNCIVATDLC